MMLVNLARAAPRRRLAEAGLFHPDAFLAAAAALLLPLALYAAGQFALLRVAYPLIAFAMAGYLYLRHSPWYVGLAIWLFCAAPLIRRLADYQLGFQQASPILLAPYLACIFAGISFIRYVLRGKAPHIGPFIAVLGCVAYGMVLAAIGGRVTSGAVDVLKWGVGPLMAVHLLSQPEQHDALHRTVVHAFTIACPLMAAYAILQFIEPQPWDVEWVSNMILTGMTSMGQPAPFELRVFGTMHSPGSLAVFLLVGVILMVGRPVLLALPGMALTLVGLALCQYRAIWGGTAIGLLVVLLGGSVRERTRILLGGVVLMLALGPMVALPEMQETIAKRFESLTTLAADESGEDRLNQYRRFLESDSNLLVGEGLAIVGASREMDGKQSTVIDSGIIEVYTALGIFGGTVLFAAIGLLVVKLLRGTGRALGAMTLYRAVVIGIFLQLPFGSVHVGESGFGAWICLGLALATMVSRSMHEGVK
jgi:hypothetical protein